ncbi:MAG: hypothetical protein MUD00_00420 [Candidatus Pacebacteria bacterium]|jgi:hypothetical protein|nr:hypothetical protein [Candidatus Paceibacterota bacterium]
MKNFIKKCLYCFYCFAGFIHLAIAIGPVCMLLYINRDVINYVISPLATLVLALAGTLSAIFAGKIPAMLSITGIILFCASWFTIEPLGVWAAQMIWFVGIGLWFSALYFAFTIKHKGQTKTA